MEAELAVRVLGSQRYVPIGREVVAGGSQRGHGGRHHSDFRVALVLHQHALHPERNDGHDGEGGCHGHQEAAEEGGDEGAPLQPGVVDGGFLLIVVIVGVRGWRNC
ncbi:hypothetical protein PIB30_055533 [Stylosanthes scabra]|uniref:Uncharacterized protein n=1 Tax=Stylosanthes scabra TaxID=79078 RepID=A0ABU6SJ18_9FABA|nr:hypothetical protein [Stylosanthes scabra]